ncbi:ABC transporter permease [Gordonia sp. (in: high G+C Gram-positive bacteria)]|uniref:ABC transporter permease n=1 Tax=Gordonia sp. (in: high G+C Gram-positive bacteria) TaxID=84139 RepID=UPI0035292054
MTHAFTFPERRARQPEWTARALLRGSLIQAERILVKWCTDIATLLQSLMFPALMVLLFWLILNRSVSGYSGTSTAFGMVPMVALTGAMSGAAISGLGLRREAAYGFLTRLWVLPVHRASAMLGRLFAESVRILATVVLVLAVGTVIGFRIQTGITGALAILAVALLFGLSFSITVTALTLRRPESRIVEWTAVGTNLAMFFNTGFVPASAYPAWLRPVVQYQPMSCAVDAIRGLATGAPIAGPLVLTAAWSLALAAVFTRLALTGYRRSAQRG